MARAPRAAPAFCVMIGVRPRRAGRAHEKDSPGLVPAMRVADAAASALVMEALVRLQRAQTTLCFCPVRGCLGTPTRRARRAGGGSRAADCVQISGDRRLTPFCINLFITLDLDSAPTAHISDQ